MPIRKSIFSNNNNNNNFEGTNININQINNIIEEDDKLN
jgi:hypothetical protein